MENEGDAAGGIVALLDNPWVIAIGSLAALVAVLSYFEMTPKNLWALIQRRKETGANDAATAPPAPKNARGFVGREDALADLASKLKVQKGVAITGKTVVQGAGGLGKTTLAREFVARNSDDYDVSLWVEADTRANATGCILADGCLALGVEVPAQQSPEAARQVMSELCASGKSLLVVFDNVDEYNSIKDLLPEGDTVDLILTTRAAGGYPGFEKLSLDVMDYTTEDSPAVELLLQEAERTDDRKGARELAEALGGLPLGLVTAGRLIREEGGSFGDYRGRLMEILLDEPPQGDDYPDSVRAAVKLSYDKLSEDAQLVADIFAWWAPEGLDGALISDAPHGENWAAAIRQLPSEIAGLAQDPARISQAIIQLSRLSLIQRGAEDYEMHRLTRLCIRLLQPEGRGVSATSLLAAQYPYDSDFVENWKTCRRLTPHARAIWRTGNAPNNSAMDMLMNQCGGFLTQQDDLPGALACLRASLEMKRQRLGEEDRHIPLALGNLAQQMIKLDGEEAKREAVSMIEQAIALDEKYRPGSDDLAGSYMQAATIHLRYGKGSDAASFEKGLEMVALAKPLWKELKGHESQEMSHCLHIEAALQEAMGNLYTAIEIEQEAIRIRQGGDKANLTVSLNNLGGKLLKAGAPDRAYPPLVQALEVAKEIYAEVPDHSNLRITAQWLALCCLVRGKAGQNPYQREMEAKSLCNDYGLDFDNLNQIAGHFPTSPVIKLPPQT